MRVRRVRKGEDNVVSMRNTADVDHKSVPADIVCILHRHIVSDAPKYTRTAFLA